MSLSTEELLKLIIDTSEEFKAVDLKVLQVDHICDFADYFVIMSGTSTTQVQSLAEELHYRSKHADRHSIGEEGMASAEWCLLDFGDIVVHVFLPAKREHYDLENLWADALVIYPNDGGEAASE